MIDREFAPPMVLEVATYRDQRGQFAETFNLRDFREATGSDVQFVQDNESISRAGVLRGMHYQVEPYSQAKLVRATVGAVVDVVVDIRKSSPTFTEWFAVELRENDGKQLWVPSGYAHGFLALTDMAIVQYKVSDYYSPEHDRSLNWADREIAIDWPLEGDPILSEKDATAPLLAEAELFD